jgi:NRPS condensation-like uncharacterized protein
MTDKLNRYSTSAQDKMNFIARSTADQQLRVVVSFAGHIDETVLARAVRIVMDREPVLGSRFVELPNRTYWERRSDLDQLELCRVVDANPAIQMAFLTRPTDPRTEPLLQARIFRSPENDILVLKVDHVAADGTGSKEAAYLVADTYNRLLADPNYRPGLGKFNPRSQAAFFRQAGLKNLLKYRPRSLNLPHQSRFTLPFNGNRNDGQSFAVRTLAPETVRSLKAYGIAHGATLNDLMLAAFYRALGAACNPAAGKAYSIQVPIDLRRSLPEGKEQLISNLSGGLFPAVAMEPGETFSETLASVKSAMARWKSGQPGLTGAMLMELAFALGYAKGKAQVQRLTTAQGTDLSPLLLSNLGVLDVNRLRFGNVKIESAYELGPIMLNHGLMLTASTWADRLTLGMGYCQGNLAAEIMEGLVEAVKCELECAQ